MGKIIGDIWPYTFWVYCFILNIGEVFVELIITPGSMVNGDVQLLRVVIKNVLGNAGKFTDDQPQTTIECSCTSNNGNPIFCGRDNGGRLETGRLVILHFNPIMLDSSWIEASKPPRICGAAEG